MNISHFECLLCKSKYRTPSIHCSCGAPLRVVYHPRPRISWASLRSHAFTHWRYHSFLPDIKDPLTLDEGHTPLIKEKNMYLKLEGCNPTGSFKDRGSTVEISLAQKKHVICASTGNMGASVAAYCAKADLPCTVILPHNTPEQKIKQINIFGASIQKVQGHYTHAAAFAQKLAQKHHAYLAGDYAYRREGEKTVVFEIIDQLGFVPDRIICPLGNGTLISALWQGLKDFRTARLIQKMPVLIGVQAAGCSPIVTAFTHQRPIHPVTPKTIASAVACGNPLDGITALHALAQSKGSGITITDQEIIHARRKLAAEHGIDAEPGGVLPFAAFKKLKQHNKKTVLIITGSGLKDMVHL